MAEFPRPRPSFVIPGKEDGVHAGYDKDGRELVYIGMGEMTMHRDVIDRIEREFKRWYDSDGKAPRP